MVEATNIGGGDHTPPPTGPKGMDPKIAMEKLQALMGARAPAAMSEPQAFLEVLKLLDRELERMHETFRQHPTNQNHAAILGLHKAFGAEVDHLDTLFREERLAKRVK